MNGTHTIGLFKVREQVEFEGVVNFEFRSKTFLTYEKAYDYVLEAFKRNNIPFSWGSKSTFEYETKNAGMIMLVNYVVIEMVSPFYIRIGREWL